MASSDVRLAVLVIALVAGYGAYLARSREPGMVVLKLGVLAALAIACAGELWIDPVAGLVSGRLPLAGLSRWWMATQQGWWDMVLLFAPIPGLLLAVSRFRVSPSPRSPSPQAARTAAAGPRPTSTADPNS